MKNSFTYFFLKTLSIFFLCFPRNLSIKIAKQWGLFIYWFYPKRKDVATINLKVAFPDKTETEIKGALKNTYQHYTVLIVEFLRQRNINLNKININMDEETKDIISSKKGLILMSAHMGNWEMIIPILNKYQDAMIVVKIQNPTAIGHFVL